MSQASFLIAFSISYAVGAFLYSAYWTGKMSKNWDTPLVVSILSGIFFPLFFLCRAWSKIAKGISEADK